jgi:hypothetical protein
MQITIMAGGRTWIVEEGNLVGWLQSNAVQKERQIKEVIQDEPYMQSVQVLLNEKR